MKAHKLKLKLTTKKEVEDEFYAELSRRIDFRISAAVKGKGILEYARYKCDNGEQIRIEEKLELLKEYERKGRSTRFSDESVGELIYKKHYGPQTIKNTSPKTD